MKFYKITNAEEKHGAMKYQTGLNVDILPFKGYGNCEDGGIYFAREDILAFLDYGCYLREVALPDNAQVYENPGFPKKWKADKVVLGEKVLIDAGVIEKLIKEGADVNAYKGHLEIVKLLIENGAESGNGHLEIVKLLIENGAK